MSLDKAIEHGKERRKQYRGSKAIDPSCRNHGGCPWCEGNRKHKFRDKEMGESKRFEYIIEFEPFALQNDDEICFKSRHAQKLIRCGDCRHRDPEDKKCDCGGIERQGCPFEVADDYFCAYGESK